SVVSIRELASVAGIATRSELRVFREHPPLDGAEMPDDVGEREFAGLVGPLAFVGRNARNHAHRTFANALEVLDDLSQRSPSCVAFFAACDDSTPRMRYF